jgi:hypothetical protein
MTFIRKTNSLMKFIDSNPLEFYFDFSILTSNNFIWLKFLKKSKKVRPTSTRGWNSMKRKYRFRWKKKIFQPIVGEWMLFSTASFSLDRALLHVFNVFYYVLWVHLIARFLINSFMINNKKNLLEIVINLILSSKLLNRLIIIDHKKLVSMIYVWQLNMVRKEKHTTM